MTTIRPVLAVVGRLGVRQTRLILTTGIPHLGRSPLTFRWIIQMLDDWLTAQYSNCWPFLPAYIHTENNSYEHQLTKKYTGSAQTSAETSTAIWWIKLTWYNLQHFRQVQKVLWTRKAPVCLLTLLYTYDKPHLCINIHHYAPPVIVLWQTTAVDAALHALLIHALRWQYTSVSAFTCVGWQVTLCDHIWQVTLNSSETDFHEELYSDLTLSCFSALSLLVDSVGC